MEQALFSALAEPTRRRILMLLTKHGELCVCELVHALEMAQPRISSHLAALRKAGLVRARKQGLWVHYSPHPDLPDWARRVLRTTLSAVRDRAPYAEDAARLATMEEKERPPERQAS
jgi:ArsR family transcriptional regulator